MHEGLDPNPCHLLLTLRGDVSRGSTSTPLLCAHSVVSRVIRRANGEGLTPCVILAWYGVESNASPELRENETAVRAAVRQLYERAARVDVVAIARQPSQAGNFLAVMDATWQHRWRPHARALLVLRSDLYLKPAAFGPGVLANLVAPVEHTLLAAFPTRQRTSWNLRPMGSRQGCWDVCRPQPRIRNLTLLAQSPSCRFPCDACGAFPGEPKCPTARATPTLATSSNDVIFGFSPATLWPQVREHFVRAARGARTDLHWVAAAVSSHACISYLTSHAYDANSGFMTNPVYEMLPRGLERVQANVCLLAADFARTPVPRALRALARNVSGGQGPICCAASRMPACPYMQAAPDPRATPCRDRTREIKHVHA